MSEGPKTARTMTAMDALAAARARRQAGELDAARQLCKQALELAPRSGSVLFLMGLIEYEAGAREAGLTLLQRAVAAAPDNSGIKVNLGRMLVGLGRLEEAIAVLREVLTAAPDHEEATALLFGIHQSVGRSACLEGRIDIAKPALEEALAIRPDDPVVRYFHAEALLLSGQLEDGFAGYEWRWQVPDFALKRQSLSRPQWDGGDLRGRTILIHPEQGMGDSIQFCRYVPILKERGATSVLLAARPELMRLLTTLDGLDDVIDWKAKLPPFDVHASIMSLPHLCGTTLNSIPNAVPYLQAVPQAVTAWRDRLSVLPGRKIGLAWGGNPQYSNDKQRSLAIEQLEPLLSLPGVFWISLQVDERRHELDRLGERAPLALAEELVDFVETAGVIANLDAVVCVDTAVAHLAGALGQTVYLMLPHRPNWRWLMERNDSPWYPSMRLFRQGRPGDWAGVVADIAAALQAEG